MCPLRGRLVLTLGLTVSSSSQSTGTETEHGSCKSEPLPLPRQFHALSEQLGVHLKTRLPITCCILKSEGPQCATGQGESPVLLLSPPYQKEPVQSVQSLQLQQGPKLRDAQELSSDDRQEEADRTWQADLGTCSLGLCLPWAWS